MKTGFRKIGNKFNPPQYGNNTNIKTYKVRRLIFKTYLNKNINVNNSSDHQNQFSVIVVTVLISDVETVDQEAYNHFEILFLFINVQKVWTECRVH